jgi:hypothetical protein
MRQGFFQTSALKLSSSFFSLFLLLSVFAPSAPAQQSQATLRGQVLDLLGGIVIGVNVTAIDAAGNERTATTDEQGQYVFPSLPPGRYTIRVEAPGFLAYENRDVEITAGRTEPFDVILSVAGAAEEVTVNIGEEEGVGTEPENNSDAVVLRGDDLDSLPDDPEDLAEALQALAGPAAGVDEEGQVYIDGFTGGRLPPKESIREIRINRNPFSAEYDRLGYGRIEIFTKPGTDNFRGQAFFNFNDESLNSRSPFASVRAPYQSRRYGGNVSGPIIAKKLSFFFDFQRREVDDNDDITAIILDPALNPIPFNETILSPTRRTTFSPRLDWQINETNTLVLRYTYETSDRINEGVGGFNLASRAYNSDSTQHTFQLTETTVINQSIINETRFQYERNRRNQEGGTFAPTIRVLDAFTGGGAQIGQSFNNQDRIELQNFTSWTAGRHSLKAGIRIRSSWTDNASEQNFAGTYTFSGGTAPQLDANNQVVLGQNGLPVTTQITSLERYRRTLLFQQLGLSAAEIRARGGGATQFSISGGDPEIKYRQTDFSPFIQDDWRVNPNLTLSFGLRYDWQSNIDSKFNFAPRFGFAWSPQFGEASSADQAGGRRAQRSVIRGGIGVFYNNFNESLLSQTLRFNGVSQQQYVITTATENGFSFLDQFPNVPTVEDLTDFAVRQSVRRLDEDLRTPYTIQTALSYERQLPYRTSLSVNFVNANTRNVFRSRNINAPLPGTFVPGVPGSGVRPFPTEGNIFQYESTGRFNQQQLIFSLNTRFSELFTVRANYTLNRAKSDTDGLGNFPVNQYDLSGEYGRSLQDTRHRVTIFGTINALPWGIRLNPILIASSGRPFNIITGRDTNGDTLFTERPAFADEQTTPADLRVTPFGEFDVNPKPGQVIIPRNYGTGPAFAVVNLRISKAFGFGGEAVGGAAAGGDRRGGGGGGRGGGGGGAGRGVSETRSRYNLNLSVNIQNLFNNTNEGIPSGNLSSPFFGVSTAGAGGFGRGGGAQAAGNRRIDLQVRFNF